MSTSSNVLTGLTPDAANSELDAGITGGLAAVDTLSASRLDNLGLVHQARITQLTRTVNSLTAQFGADSRQVVAAQAAVSATQAVVARVLVVKQQTAETAPVVASGGWAVWGHVYSSTSTPLSGYCVFLVDAQKNYQCDYGFQFTDSTGAFVISYAGPASGGEQAAATLPTVYLAITNAKAQLVCEGAKALALALGSALYIDTTLAAGEPVVGDLPAEIKRVAQPRQDAK
jgi:hypothetical protein